MGGTHLPLPDQEFSCWSAHYGLEFRLEGEETLFPFHRLVVIKEGTQRNVCCNVSLHFLCSEDEEAEYQTKQKTGPDISV